LPGGTRCLASRPVTKINKSNYLSPWNKIITRLHLINDDVVLFDGGLVAVAKVILEDVNDPVEELDHEQWGH